MEETLRAARGIVRSLWVLCATTLLVVFQDAPARELNAVSRELDALGRVSQRGFATFLQACIESDRRVAEAGAVLSNFMEDSRRPDAQARAYSLSFAPTPYDVFVPLAEDVSPVSLTRVLDRGDWTRIPSALVLDAAALRSFVEGVEPQLRATGAEQIGRASCRERVSPYV